MSHALPADAASPDAALAPPSGGISWLATRLRDRVQDLTLVQRIGLAALAFQFAGFAVWSWVLWHRFALTWDFGVYHQPWWLIAHGHLDPRTTIESMPFWRNDAEFMIWPLAPLYWVLGNCGLLWAQDAGVVGAELVAFWWICELTAGRRNGNWLAGAGLVLLAVNPWLWWSVSFDFHMECVAVPFALLLARDLWHERSRMWCWVVPVLLCGAPEAVYVIGIGAGAALCGRKYWRRAAILAAAGVAWSGLIIVLHADNGAPLSRHYGYIALGAVVGKALSTRMSTGEMVEGIVGHPARILVSLWAKRADVAAAIVPGGILGLAWRPLAPAVLIGLLSAILSAGWRFAQPSFQLMPVYVMLAVGTAAALAWLAKRHARITLALAAFLAAQAIGWAIVWYPQVMPHWLRVSRPATAELSRAEAIIPQSAEVIVSQGVLGPFTSRPDVMALTGQARMPVRGREVWFIITPHAGTELDTPTSAMAFAAELAGPLHATLVTHGAGVWAFRWHRPAAMHYVPVPDGSGTIPGWLSAGAAGTAVTSGQPGTWHARSDGRRGYVVSGLTWLEAAGSYTASVSITAAAGTNVELWDDSGRTSPLLLARRTMAGGGRQTVTLTATAPRRQFPVFSGTSLFSAKFVAPLPGQRLEVRVWSPGTGPVRVYGASLRAAS